jgi:hypothetical protein
MESKIELVFDTKLKRPACVLLQAAYGCGHNNPFMETTFDASKWLTFPTENMAKISGTREQWEKLAKKINSE